MLIQWRASSQWVVLRFSPSRGIDGRAFVGMAISADSKQRLFCPQCPKGTKIRTAPMQIVAEFLTRDPVQRHGDGKNPFQADATRRRCGGAWGRLEQAHGRRRCPWRRHHKAGSLLEEGLYRDPRTGG